MPQTKHKRKTKHRGNAAGIVEARGRTGRKPTAAERSAGPRGSNGSAAKASTKKTDRFDKPPTWRGAFLRSMAAAVVMLLISLLLIKKPSTAIELFPIVLIFYVPISYYTDSFLYKRRQRQKARAAQQTRT